MQPIKKIYNNRPPPIETFQPTRRRKSKLESEFNRLYPEVKWEAKALSLKFMIPFHITRELINDKPKLLKIIFDSLK